MTGSHVIDAVRDMAWRLSAPQRKAVLWLPADGSSKDHRRVTGANDGISNTTLGSLKERIVGTKIYRLVQYSFNTGAREKGQVWKNDEYRLTPLGLAVRAELERGQ